MNFDDLFGGYTREQLEEALSSIDPKRNPEDYAAVKEALARALPAEVGESCLDVEALRKLDAVVRTSTESKAISIVTAAALTVYLVWHFLLDQNFDSAVIYWERAALIMGLAAVMWAGALWKTTTDSYRFAGGTIRCTRLGQIAWEQSLSDLVWVEEKVTRRDSCLLFHWRTLTRRVELQLSDFKEFGVVVSSPRAVRTKQ
jgi:hypothetical protein